MTSASPRTTLLWGRSCVGIHAEQANKIRTKNWLDFFAAAASKRKKWTQSQWEMPRASFVSKKLGGMPRWTHFNFLLPSEHKKIAGFGNNFAGHKDRLQFLRFHNETNKIAAKPNLLISKCKRQRTSRLLRISRKALLAPGQEASAACCPRPRRRAANAT